jgi:hypothetical protein
MYSDSGIGGLTQAFEFQRGLDGIFGGNARAPKLVSAATVKGKGSRHMGAALVAQMLHWEAAPDGSVPPTSDDGLKMALLANPPAPLQPERQERNENQHPGFVPHDGGPNPTLLRRHRPKKPFQQQTDGWNVRYGVPHGPFGRYSPPGGQMAPWEEM